MTSFILTHSTESKLVLDSGTGSVERLEDKVIVGMNAGVSLVCYTMNAADVCVVSLSGNGLNNTIGKTPTASIIP